MADGQLKNTPDMLPKSDSESSEIWEDLSYSPDMLQKSDSESSDIWEELNNDTPDVRKKSYSEPSDIWEELNNDTRDVLQKRDSEPSDTWAEHIAVDFAESAVGVRLEAALEAAEFGWFHVILWSVCGGVYWMVAQIPNIISYHASSVKCDLNLSNNDILVVNCVTYAGTVTGTLIWGILSDLVGRRYPFIFCLILNFAAALILTFSSGLPSFIISMFFNSFSSSGSIVLTLTYLAELQMSSSRGSAISFMQIFWALGCISLTAATLPWTTLSALTGISALVLAIVVWIMFPESPRFLLCKGRSEDALKSLQDVFISNTKHARKQFPVKVLLNDENVDDINTWNTDEEQIPRYLKPERFCFPVLLFSKFMFIFGFYSLTLRVPGLLTRYEYVFHTTHDSSNCILYQHPTRQQQHITMSLVDPATDVGHACSIGSNPQHLYNLIEVLGYFCVPVIACLAYNIDRLGRKFFVVMSHVIAGYLTFFWFITQDPALLVMFASIYQALCSISVASTQCLAVELVRTKFRATFVACLLGVGRLGFILADLGFLLNFNVSCIGLDIFIAATFILSGVLILCLPDTSGMPLR